MKFLEQTLFVSGLEKELKINQILSVQQHEIFRLNQLMLNTSNLDSKNSIIKLRTDKTFKQFGNKKSRK